MASETLTTRPGEGADPGVDPTRSYDVGMRLRGEALDGVGAYVGDIEVMSPVSGRLPTVALTVVAENLSVGRVSQRLRPDELRELAGALERAADHHELVAAGERRSDGAVA